MIISHVSSQKPFIDRLSRMQRLVADCPQCPTCFDCLKDGICLNNSTCSTNNGKCTDCPMGFGGDACGTPLCQSPVNKKRKPPNGDDLCECDDGWTGVNCNVCLTDDACVAFFGPGTNATCYKEGIVVNKQFRSCDVKLPPLLQMGLGDKKPYVTTQCTAPSAYEQSTCSIQFFVMNEENFYCNLENCNLRKKPNNETEYYCPKASCKCAPGTLLCDPDGIDITDALDAVQGPGSLKCMNSTNCLFSEPVLDVYFSNGVELKCKTGECLLPSQIPGYEPPIKTVDSTLIVGIGFSAIVFVAFLGMAFKIYVKRQKRLLGRDDGDVADESEKLIASHIPACFAFENIGYKIGDRQILDKVSGIVKPGELLAIMGGSGAGKSTCLDILAGKSKMGTCSGTISVNGTEINPKDFKKVIGFVDQEDTLLGTLTVRETLMYSAMLRLPREMSLKAKKHRVQQTMDELGISHIADRKIGAPGKRGISGGEKRRVSIAQELVTSPPILFLDEPTSGLDAYNAFVVIETLSRLAIDYNRTIIFTIHQPRSNIYTKFDKLLLLANGQMVYSGVANAAGNHFETFGYPCPLGYNTADFLIDLTLKSEDMLASETSSKSFSSEDNSPVRDISPERSPTRSPERKQLLSTEIPTTQYSPKKKSFLSSFFKKPHHRQNHHRQKSANTISVIPSDNDLTDIEKRIQKFSSSFYQTSAGETLMHSLKNNLDQTSSALFLDTMHSRDKLKGASYFTQISILSGRTLLNLYRNPFLLFSHYLISMVLAVFTGFLFWQVSNDLPGVQNRLGCLFFICAFFGLSSLTSLELFAPERLLFTRERSNGFYSPSAYFVTKILFDIIPLRTVPPLLFGSIVYYMVGLYPLDNAMPKFLLALVLFNLCCAAICLVIALIFKHAAVGNLVATLTMLFSMLFSGFLLNKDKIIGVFSWLKYLSVFNYGYEAMIVNELVKINLHDTDVVEIEIPGTIILNQFGFNIKSYWRNIVILSVMFCSLLILAFALLKVFVKERR
ncbi:ABC transporter domain-containing protein [Rozella allomycis CSF55]|uniref:ABC transporter domain-containing protein n=2 Tax=Rozella allomycis (strain CSF55) TaxID=988480 RepID=A0A075AX08_ROZAC|nr:ABC transporter domain-containing protein [Rozella allomycis CSF55]|eukprot:EPZ33247.1 ABC transporter domain-containing protein [Rozella allomycis CSF55]